MSKINILNLVLFIIVITLAIVIYYSEQPNTQLNRLTNLDVKETTDNPSVLTLTGGYTTVTAIGQEIGAIQFKSKDPQ